MARLALPTPTRARSLQGALLALALAFAVLPGCDAAALENVAGADDGNAPPDAAPVCYENTVGQCVVATFGCDPDNISGGVVERCATCDVNGSETAVCGPARTARCFDLELSEPCQRCVTDDGEVLYDDCAAAADDLGDLRCESVRYDSDDDTTCEVCRDDNGQVVRESCRPNAATCSDVVMDGRACRECFTAEGALAYRECERPDLDPRVCEVYGGSAGRCVDCYGDADELLTHECTLIMSGEFDGGAGAPQESEVQYCDSVSDPGGRSCERCYSADGALVNEYCDDGLTASPGRCEELVFAEQTCLLCVDDSGQESSTLCYSATGFCTSPESCPPPPPCENRYLDDGTLCRTCASSSGEVVETRCMSGGDLVCETVERYSEAPPAEGESDPSVVTEVCTVCTVDGAQVYEACASDGSVPPQPVCSPQTTEDNVTCEVCVDPSNNEPIYSSCDAQPGSSPEPIADSCVEENGVPLTSEAGEQLYLPPADDAAVADAAIADCFSCASSEDPYAAQNTGTCILQHECTSPETDPSVCAERTKVAYDPTQCQEPWGDHAGATALVKAMAWLLEHHGIVVHALDDEAVAADFSGACQECDCPRGDRYLFEVSASDAEIMMNIGAGFYLP